MNTGDRVVFMDRHADDVKEGEVLEVRRDKWISDQRVFIRLDDGRELMHVHGSEIMAVLS